MYTYTRGPDSNAIFQCKGYVRRKVCRKKFGFCWVHKMSERGWQYGEQTLEPVKPVRTIVTAADNPQQQPR